MKITSNRSILSIIWEGLKLQFTSIIKQCKKNRIQLILQERHYFRRNKRLVRKTSNRISSQRPKKERDVTALSSKEGLSSA